MQVSTLCYKLKCSHQELLTCEGMSTKFLS